MSKGFWVQGKDGSPIHVKGDPDMSEETLQAILDMADLAAAQVARTRQLFEQIWNQWPLAGDKEVAWRWFKRGYDLRVHQEEVKR